LTGEVSSVAQRRILFVTVANHRFANMTVNQRIRAFLPLGQVEIFALFPDSFPPDIASRVRIHRPLISRRFAGSVLRLPLFTLEAAAWAASQLARGRRYDAVYAFQDTSALAGWLFRARGAGWFIDAVDDPALELRNAQEQRRIGKVVLLALRDMFFRTLVRRADLVVTIGSDDDDVLPRLLRSRYRVPEGRILPLSQAIDVDALRRAPAAASASLRKPSVFYVGWVSPLRGMDTLLEAARTLWAEGTSFELRLAGPLKPEDRPWLDAAVASASGKLVYLGETPSPVTLQEIAHATACVYPFPDRPELAPVQPVKVLEYMSLAKPVVASRLPGTERLMTDGREGILVEPSNSAAMAKALGELLGDPDLSSRMGTLAARRAEEFDVSRMNTRLLRRAEPWL
jgi:glycosyltransferase involved in cell wall biosynthesis